MHLASVAGILDCYVVPDGECKDLAEQNALCNLDTDSDRLLLADLQTFVRGIGNSQVGLSLRFS
jgi:hypothetical protein